MMSSKGVQVAAVGAFGVACWLGGTLYERNRAAPKIYPKPVLQNAPRPSDLPLVQSQNDSRLDAVARRTSEIMRFGFPSLHNIRSFDDFILSYDTRNRVANWVFEHLTQENLKVTPNVDRSKCEFHEDKSIHPLFRATNDDYKRSGFDRGHLAAAGNHRLQQHHCEQTFTLSNIAPQVGVGFNRDAWNKLEKYVRRFTNKYSDVYVCTGPIYAPICCNPLSLGGFVSFLSSVVVPGAYIKSLEIGNGIVEDTMNGFFKNSNDQVAEACQLIENDSRLKNGYNAIGFSQGAQFLRAVAQRCPNGMKNLISLGGQHQGIYGFPHCFYPDHKICDYVRVLLDKGAYLSFVQNKFVQAQYWHDPINEDEYRRKSVFLADINNERSINQGYINGLMNLHNFVMVKFADDTMVIPKESSWFEFYTPGQGVQITPLNSSALYIEDRLGLRQMDQYGKLKFLTCPGDHLQVSEQWFLDNLSQYLK